MGRATRIVALLLAAAGACSKDRAPAAQPAPAASARNVLLITIDTLRADHVGAYGYGRAHTPAFDALAKSGARFDRAYAAAPITLTSHATLLTGRYPPGHGARHNGMRLDLKTPTIAETLGPAGFATAAFVAAFPLDRRFGLIKGFQTYGDRMPRDANGRPANERPGSQVVDEALQWLARHSGDRFFLWVHLFEPHAPYGNPADPAQAAQPVEVRYDHEITEADRQAGRLIDALGDRKPETLIVAAGDHGEAFGEHGEISHSLFTYDITLRVPLILSGPGIAAGRMIADPVSLVDVAATIARAAGAGRFDSDGVDLKEALDGRTPSRALYAESFAPLLDFGWSPLRTIRADGWKYIAAPHPELYDLKQDPAETVNLISREPARAADLAHRTDAISSDVLAAGNPAPDRETLARLQALGYVSGRRAAGTARPDPKDRRELAGAIAQVTSGELQGAALERALRRILQQDPTNPQANLRLGYVLADSNRCRDAAACFTAAIEGHLPGADAHLGLARCQLLARNPAAAQRTLREAERLEPDNPVVSANLGIVLSDAGRPADGIPYLQRALALDPELHQARFSLAIAYARLGRRDEAAREARELLKRLPADAPQRPEVERLLSNLKIG